ncbi:MAG: hypothetical protein ACTIC1_03685 [Brevibacterium sp.]
MEKGPGGGSARSSSASERGWSVQDRPLGFGALIVAYAVHLVAWAGYVGMHVASESYFVGRPWVTSLCGFFFAAVAAACALIIGRGLPARVWSAFALVSVIVVLGAGLVELIGLVFYDADSSLADIVSIVFTPLAFLPYIGILIYPFLLAGVVVWLTISRRDAAPRLRETSAAGETPAAVNGASQQGGRRRTRIAFAVWALSLNASLIVITVLTVEFLAPADVMTGETWEVQFGLMALAGIIGAVSLVGIRRFVSTVATSVPVAAAFGTITFFALVSANMLSSLSTAQAVYSDSTGIGGILLWILVAFMFPLAGVVALIMTALVVLLRPRMDGDPRKVKLSKSSRE